MTHSWPQSPNSADGEERTSSPRRHGVLLINLGTPERPDTASVRRYLAEFLSDPAVISLPTGFGCFNGLVGSMIARFRAPRSARMYQSIWGERGSPLRSITEDQVVALQDALPRGWRVFSAMRYGHPGILETLRRIERSGVDELVVVPMYPQYSEPSTGTALRIVYEYLKTENRHMHVTVRNSWFDDRGYINAQSKLIQDYADSHSLTPDNTFLLFSTHGLPTAYIKRGDPYTNHVARTVGLVRHQLGWPVDRMSLAFQSRLGPVSWLKPFTDVKLVELARAGERRILVCPISFTVDCLETLEEIDIRYRQLVETAGAELYLTPALNDFAPFISALKHLVLRGPRRLAGAVPTVDVYTAPTAHESDNPIDGLVMVGVSVGGRLGAGLGPKLVHTDAETLQSIKKSQCDVPDLLREIQDQTQLTECWLWNTCHRFELYGWLDSAAASTATVVDMRRALLGERDTPDLDVNVLFGADAWHHLLRTAVGLNSELPGERDVLDQLHAAHRLAGCAQTASTLSSRLMKRVVDVSNDVRTRTSWDRYDTDYTYAAMAPIFSERSVDPAGKRIVVIGGSTTSAGVLRTLASNFGVPHRDMTLIYRGHKRGGQIKMLRRAIGSGRRIRVQSYAEQAVIDAVAGADLVVLGVDRDESILTGDRLRDVRPWRDRPLIVIDFNVHGSTKGLESLDGVTVFDAKQLAKRVAGFAESRCLSDGFRRTVDAVEGALVEVVASTRTGAPTPGRVTDVSELAANSIPTTTKPSTPQLGSNLAVTSRSAVDGGASHSERSQP